MELEAGVRQALDDVKARGEKDLVAEFEERLNEWRDKA